MQARKTYFIWLLILLYIPSSLQMLVVESLHVIDHLAHDLEDFFIHTSDHHHHHDHHHHYDVHQDDPESDDHFIDYTKKKIECVNHYTNVSAFLQVFQKKNFGQFSFPLTLVDQPPIPPPKA